MLTQTELKELLHYDSNTGTFTWVKPRKNVTVGSVAGSLKQSGYVVLTINRHAYPAHRAAFLYMDGSLPPNAVDHINGVKSDNRWANLRHASSAENARNRRKLATSTSSYKGVAWNKQEAKWKVACTIAGKRQHLGYYTSEKEAATAYRLFAQKAFGKFYCDRTA